jgi:hypothetical protein
MVVADQRRSGGKVRHFRCKRRQPARNGHLATVKIDPAAHAPYNYQVNARPPKGTGAPVSRHVVNRVPSPKVIVEDEATAIGDPLLGDEWAEEKSTTVEASDQRSRLREFADAVAAQNRANTPVATSAPSDRTLTPDQLRKPDVVPSKVADYTEKSGNSTMEELTVDEPRRQQNINSMEITGAALANARLTVITGSDKGRELDLRAGQSFTVGRGIDNDLVLTDIAASRKHFDLRYDGENWCLKDRGSGNGTLINAVEKNDEVRLYNLDRIEIGNTVFEFDHPTCAERPAAGRWTDDEESTVGRSAKEVAQGRQLPPPPMELSAAPFSASSSALPSPASSMSMTNPKARRKPTTAPTPPRPVTQQPPPMRGRPTKPPPTNSPRPPEIVPLQPLHFTEPPMQSPGPAMLGTAPRMGPQPGALPTTMPGSPPPAIRPAHDSRPQPFAQSAMPAGSFPAYVQPPGAQYGMNQPSPNALHDSQNARRNNRTFPPALSDSRSSERMRAQPSSPPMFNSVGSYVDPTAMVPRHHLASGTSSGTLTKRNKRIAIGVGIGLLAAIATAAALGGRAGKDDKKNGPISSDVGSGTAVAIAMTTVDASTSPEVTPIKGPEVHSLATQDAAPSVDAAKVAVVVAAIPDAAVVAPVKPEPVKPEIQKPVIAKPDPIKPDSNDSKAAKKAEKERLAKERADKIRIAKENAAKAEPATDEVKPPKADGGAKKQVNDLYAAKKFADAAKVAKASGNKELMSLASSYGGLGRLYNVGMAPGTKPSDALDMLQSALTYDGKVGGEYSDEIRKKMADVAPRAVSYHLGAQNWRGAAAAVRIAEARGVGDNATVKAARTKLEREAGNLFTEAQGATPEEAKKKYQTILSMVDESSKWYGKAKSALDE